MNDEFSLSLNNITAILFNLCLRLHIRKTSFTLQALQQSNIIPKEKSDSLVGNPDILITNLLVDLSVSYRRANS